MNCVRALIFRLSCVAFAVTLIYPDVVSLKAQTPPAQAVKPAAPAAEEDPFAPPPVTPLPPGMTGSTMNDPRVGLKPGFYDAGRSRNGSGARRLYEKAGCLPVVFHES